jgi:hypothetical protein
MIPGPTSTAVGDVPDYQHWHIGHGPGLTESVGVCSKRLLRIDVSRLERMAHQLGRHTHTERRKLSPFWPASDDAATALGRSGTEPKSSGARVSVHRLNAFVSAASSTTRCRLFLKRLSRSETDASPPSYLYVACCDTACCTLAVACPMLSVACCTAHAARCELFVEGQTYAARCMLHGAWCVVMAGCCEPQLHLHESTAECTHARTRARAGSRASLFPLGPSVAPLSTFSHLGPYPA